MSQQRTLNYAPEVKKALQELIKNNKNEPISPWNQPYIVTDWDNTAIIFDSQQTLFLYQIEMLHYRLTPERFVQIIEMDLTDQDKEKVKELLYDIGKCYRRIYADYKGMAGQLTLEEVKRTAEYEIFYLAMACLYKYPFGHYKECCRILYLFENYHLEEVAEMTKASIGWAEAKTPEEKEFDYERNGKSWHAVYYPALRFVAEQEDFYRQCMKNGIAVYVCSASHQTVVEVHAARYGIPAENVLAVLLQTDEAGKIQAAIKTERPPTILEGKAEAIRHTILPKHGRDPLLVLGDSMGDFAMMTEFDCLRLLVHTKYLPKILQEMEKRKIDKNSIFIQGRDDVTATFLPNEDWETF